MSTALITIAKRPTGDRRSTVVATFQISLGTGSISPNDMTLASQSLNPTWTPGNERGAFAWDERFSVPM
jgi:hypothetical protein